MRAAARPRRAPRRRRSRSPVWTSHDSRIQAGASRWSETRTSKSRVADQPAHHRRADRAGAAGDQHPAHSATAARSRTVAKTRPAPVTFHGSTSSTPSGRRAEQVLEAGVVGGDHHGLGAVERGLERLRARRHVRVVARDVGQLALEQAHELERERVAQVVGVALEGEAEHGDLAVAQRAAQPRLEPLDEEQRHGLVHARDGQQHAGRARALLGEGEVLAQAGAGRQARAGDPAARVVVVDQVDHLEHVRAVLLASIISRLGSANCV